MNAELRSEDGFRSAVPRGATSAVRDSLEVGRKQRRRPPLEGRLHLDGDKPNSVPTRLPAPVTIISLNPPKRVAACLATRWCDYYPEAVRLRERDGRPGLPVLSCTAWGLSCPGACAPGGGLLPRLFTLTRDLRRGRFVFCDTIHRAGLSPDASAHSTRHAALWCSDFPLPACACSDHLPTAVTMSRACAFGKAKVHERVLH